jgi:pilus assembly protein Flp/PilA
MNEAFQFLWIQIKGQKARTEETGASAVEYGLLVALIAIAIIAAVTLLGGKLKDIFNNTANSLPTT